MLAKALVFDRVRNVELKELTLPEMTPQHILVETLSSAVSVGTERWLWMGLRSEIGFPSVPGYMGVGKVLEVGAAAAARGHRPGERVCFTSSTLPAGHDKTWMGTHLSRALVNVCDDVDWVEGGFNAARCEILPEAIAPEDAALCPLCAVALRGIEMAVIPAGAKVLVNGLGILGQFAAQICKLKGAIVAVADIDPKRLALAGELGADELINSKTDDVVKHGEFDVIIDTSSIPAVVNKIVPALKLWGKFVFQGWYPPPSALDLNVMHCKLPTCFFPCGFTGKALATSMRWTAEGKINCRKLITHQVKPEGAPGVYRMVEENKESFLGIVFDWK